MPLFGPPNIEKLKEKGDVKGLLKALNHKDPLIRLNAETALNELATGDVQPIISAALASNADTCRRGMDALRKLGTAGIEPIVSYVLQNEAPMGRAELLGDLRDLRTEVEETLIAHLNDDEDLEVRAAAAVTLGELGDARAVQPLTAALEEDEVDVRVTAALALGQLGEARAVEPLIAALQDEEVVVRAAAAHALGLLGDARAMEPLTAALEDEDENVSDAAADALEGIGAPEAE